MNDKIKDIQEGISSEDLDKRRAYRYALLLIGIGCGLVVLAFVGEMIAIMSGVTNGLPEVVTTSAFGAGNVVMGYGAGILPSATN